MPSGSRPLAGSSSIDGVRVAEQHAGQSEPLAHAQRVACARAGCRPSSRPTSSSTSSTRDRGDAVAAASQRRWLRPRAAGVHVAGVEQRADLVQRPASVGERRPSNVASPRVGPVETEHAAHRRALPGPVGPEEAGDRPGWTSKLRSSTASAPAEALASGCGLRSSMRRWRRSVGGPSCGQDHSLGDLRRGLGGVAVDACPPSR